MLPRAYRVCGRSKQAWRFSAWGVTTARGCKTSVKESTNPTTTSTNSSNSWIDRSTSIPKGLKPYLHLARADKQVGTLLLFWPCCWGAALHHLPSTLPDVVLLAKFAVGALIMRGAGCTVNDMWDKDFDKHVERTKNRPLASGQVTMPQATAFLAAQLSCGLGVLLSFEVDTIVLGMASMPLVVAYPLMKRITNWPQLFLGLTFNWGALVGYSAAAAGGGGVAAMNPGLLLPVLPMYAAGVCWTLVYDTLYGYQDRGDDKKLGLKSTSLHLGDEPQVALSLIATGMLAGLGCSGAVAQLSPAFYVGISAVYSQLLWQIWTADVSLSATGNDQGRKNLWIRFDSNKHVGAAVFASILLGRVI